MQTDKMKNMIVLKDIPSNIIDEAIIILKDNKKKTTSSVLNNDLEKRNIVQEAELIINNYVSQYENRNDYYKNKIELKYKRLKIISIILVLAVCVMSMI